MTRAVAVLILQAIGIAFIAWFLVTLVLLPVGPVVMP